MQQQLAKRGLLGSSLFQQQSEHTKAIFAHDASMGKTSFCCFKSFRTLAEEALTAGPWPPVKAHRDAISKCLMPHFTAENRIMKLLRSGDLRNQNANLSPSFCGPQVWDHPAELARTAFSRFTV